MCVCERVCMCYSDLVLPQAFMFESSLSMAITEWAEKTCQKLDHTYYTCWQGLKKNFDPNWKPPEK